MDYNTRIGGNSILTMSQSETDQHFEMKHSGTRHLFEYWSDLRGGRTAPYKSEITARGIGRTLAANTFILENLGDATQRFRLAGSHLHDLFGLEIRGMSALSIMQETSRARFQSLIGECLAGPVIGLLECSATTFEGSSIGVEIIMAPLRSDFDQMNRMLGAIHLLEGDQTDLIPAARQCEILSASTFDFAGSRARGISAPSPSFAEEATEFDFQNVGLKSISGGAKGGERRRGHLKVVKD